MGSGAPHPLTHVTPHFTRCLPSQRLISILFFYNPPVPPQPVHRLLDDKARLYTGRMYLGIAKSPLLGAFLLMGETFSTFFTKIWGCCDSPL
jgi:hypothetical protein